jgi:glycosyltransferase involved in cell wall biosynthesis
MKFSILMACYNCGPWIKHAIRSVLKQTHIEWELLILNDKSTDNSVSIIRQFCDGKKIRLIERNDRLHCGGAYSILAHEASGEFCGILDADDALDKSAIKEIIKVYESTSADFIWTQFWLCDKNLKVLKKGFSKAPDNGKSLLQMRHAFSHWRTFRTNMREKCQIFKPGLKAAVDKWMGYSLEEAGQGVFFNKVLYYYRQRVGGLSYKGRKEWEKMKIEFASHNINRLPIKVFKG